MTYYVPLNPGYNNNARALSQKIGSATWTNISVPNFQWWSIWILLPSDIKSRIATTNIWFTTIATVWQYMWACRTSTIPSNSQNTKATSTRMEWDKLVKNLETQQHSLSFWTMCTKIVSGIVIWLNKTDNNYLTNWTTLL